MEVKSKKTQQKGKMKSQKTHREGEEKLCTKRGQKWRGGVDERVRIEGGEEGGGKERARGVGG